MSRIATVRHRSLGVLLLVVIVGLVYLTILIYGKAFTSFVDVTLEAGCQPPATAPPQSGASTTETAAATTPVTQPDGCVPATTQNQNAGHQIDQNSDVKLRGILVGSVKSITTNGNGADIHLRLDPGKVRDIPRNVSAEIIPKTLFGEKYVNLVIPQGEGLNTPRIQAGDVIRQSTTSLEIEQVFNDLLPLLQTLQPVQLNMTLSNLAIALQGRGNELGQNLAMTDSYIGALNPDLPNIETDITGMQELANNLNQATPDVLADFRQFSLNARTLVQKGSVFANFLTGTRGFADIATSILQQNEQNIVALSVDNQATLALLAQYSPEFPCLLQGFVTNEGLLSQAFQPHNSGPAPDNIAGLHLNLTISAGNNPADQDKDGSNQLQPPAYTAKDFIDYSILTDNRAYPNPGSFHLPVEGSNQTVSGPCFGLPKALPNPIALFPPTNKNDPNYQPASGSSSAAQTNAENSSAMSLARVLAAPALGVPSNDVSELAELMIAPQIAGTTVHAS
ncbi:MAG TPA: MCE family protein [Mycobacteriales bacterium]